MDKANPVCSTVLRGIVGSKDFNSVLDSGNLKSAVSSKVSSCSNRSTIIRSIDNVIAISERGIPQLTINDKGIVPTKKSSGRSHNIIERRLNKKLRRRNSISVLLNGNLLYGAAKSLSSHTGI